MKNPVADFMRAGKSAPFQMELLCHDDSVACAIDESGGLHRECGAGNGRGGRDFFRFLESNAQTLYGDYAHV